MPHTPQLPSPHVNFVIGIRGDQRHIDEPLRAFGACVAYRRTGPLLEGTSSLIVRRVSSLRTKHTGDRADEGFARSARETPREHDYLASTPSPIY
jgi:hypothetical protein